MKTVRAWKRYRCSDEDAAVMVELALAIPFILLLIAAIIDFSLINKDEAAFLKALSAASRSAWAASAVGGLNTPGKNDHIDCLKIAGPIFLEELGKFGAVSNIAKLDIPGVQAPAVLSIGPPPPTHGAGDPENMDTFFIGSWFTPRCYFCGLVDVATKMFSFDFNLTEERRMLVVSQAEGGCFPAAVRRDQLYTDWATDFSGAKRWIFTTDGNAWECSGNSCSLK